MKGKENAPDGREQLRQEAEIEIESLVTNIKASNEFLQELVHMHIVNLDLSADARALINDTANAVVMKQIERLAKMHFIKCLNLPL